MNSQQISNRLYKVPLKKQAQTAPLRMTATSRQNARTAVAKRLMSLLGLGAVAGAGVRGVTAVNDMFKDSPEDKVPTVSAPNIVSLYAPQSPAKFAAIANPEVTLAAAPPTPTAAKPGLMDTISKSLGNMIPDQMTPQTSNVMANEWTMPMAALALGGGLGGGYKLTDWLLRKEHESNKERQLDNAKKEYRDALANQYRTAMMAKNAGDDLGINSLADIYLEKGVEKRASPSLLQFFGPTRAAENTIYEPAAGGRDNWQAIKGGVNTAILTALLGSGYATYNWTKGKDKRKIMEDALKKRQRQRQLYSPPPVLAIPKDPAENGA